MSAFLVQDKTINKIVTTLAAYLHENSFFQDQALAVGINVDSDKWEEKLAVKLYELNCEALRQR